MRPTAPPAKAPQARSAAPWRVLGILTAMVLIAHAIALQRAALIIDGTDAQPALQMQPKEPSRVFSTRRIDAPAPETNTAAEARVSAVSPPRARPTRPRAMPTPEPVTEAAPPDSPAVSATPVATAQGPSETAAVIAPEAVGADEATTERPLAIAGDSQPPRAPVVLADSSRLTYQMNGQAKGLNYVASAELAWRHEGGSYDARMTVKALFLGSRSMASVGSISADGLAPVRFSDRSRSEVAAHFEPDKGLITFSANTPSAAWVPGAQDRVSVFFQLGGLLAGSPTSFPVGSTLSLFTAGPRAADTWTFRVEAEEILPLPYGDVSAVKLVRLPQRDYDQTIEIWLAPALGYLPVRNKITQSNGDFIDQQLSQLSRP